tara:strand:+ start:436 stop:768 length:333 start_codon:yes stop_codon:yes gene_type:complete
MHIDNLKLKSELDRIKDKYPDKIPVIVNKNHNCTLNQLKKNKFIVPKDLTMAQFIYIIRKRIQLDETTALFVWINNTLVPSNMDLNTAYNNYSDNDGYLYVTYTNENTFG